MKDYPKDVKILDFLTTLFALLGTYTLSFGIWEAYWLLLLANITGVSLQYKVGLKSALVRNVFTLGATILGIWNMVL